MAVDEAQDDMRAFGIGEEDVQQLEGTEGDFEIEADNWPVIEVWMVCQTQWRVSMNGRCGLDYVALDVVMRRMGVDDASGAIFAGVQVMEFAVLEQLARH